MDQASSVRPTSIGASMAFPRDLLLAAQAIRTGPPRATIERSQAEWKHRPETSHMGGCRRPQALSTLPQDETLDLAAHCLRQRIEEFKFARIGMRREPVVDQQAEFLGKFGRAVMAVPQHNESLDDFGALRVGLADDSNLCDRWMPDQDAFHLRRADAIARRRDKVVVARDEVKISVRVLIHRIAG